MPSQSWYDALADTRYGGDLLRYVLDGIDSNPSYIQRLLVGAPQNIAYALDRLGYADSPRVYLRGNTDTTDAVQEETMNARQTRNVYVNGVANRKVRTLRRTKRYGRVGAAMRANWRTRKNLPITITHQENTEVRSKPGTQAIIQFQAERRLPFEGTLSSTVAPVATGSLNPGVNRRSNNTLGVYNIGESGAGIPFNAHMRYLLATDEARTQGVLSHRSDWTMFTNASWRDGYSALNGRFASSATTQAGYITPVCTTTPDTSWFKRNTVLNVVGAGEQFLPHSPLQCIDYHHLSEELSITVTNNGPVMTTVTLYECILNHDITFMTTNGIDTEVSTISTQWGALPCPIELWRASRKLNSPAGSAIIPTLGGAGAVPNGTNQYGALDDDDGEGATGTVMGIDLEARPVGHSGGGQTGVGGIMQTQSTKKDIDHAGVRVGGQLLHHWYTIKPHKRTLAPGQTTTITIKVMYNRRIPGTWWETLIGKAGYSRTFFMVNRPGEGVATTGLDVVGSSGPGSRYGTSGPTDLVMRWSKTKQFARHDQLPRRSITFNATTPYADAWVVREPDGDMAAADIMEDDGQIGGDGLPNTT